MKSETKKIIGAIVATGAIVTGASLGLNKEPVEECEFFINTDVGEVCISEKIKEAIESQLKPNKGFGGVQFE